MSPRLPSAITSRPALRAYTHVSAKAAMPSAPSASKNASCGLTATACGATASTIPQQKRATSPRSSTGNRSGSGSRPTISWLRLRSTSAARRSPKVSVATAISVRLVPENDRGPQKPRPSAGAFGVTRGRTASLARLERRLELAARAELRHDRCLDLDALAGTRVDALPGGAGGGRELAETREVDRVAALERLGHDLHEGVDGLACVATREAGLRPDP